MQRLAEKQGTKLPVKMTNFVAEGIQVPFLSPTNWMSYIIDNGLWHRLAGVDRSEKHLVPKIWTHFWNNFEALNPHFSIFATEFDRSTTAAVFLHGDEGRTLKRNGIMITAFQSALGTGFDELRAGKKRTLDGSLKLKVNYKGHTFTNRYVTTAIPKAFYESKPEVFRVAMHQLGQDFEQLQTEGIKDKVTGETYRVCVIGCKGDMPYLQKMGGLLRAFNTGAKRGKEQHQARGICHLCLAGREKYPSEELSTLKPRWLITMGVEDPWHSLPSILNYVPYDLSNPASFFYTDVWHVFHLGVGKSFVSSVIQLALPQVPERNLPEKWTFLSSSYREFCVQGKKQLHVSKITPFLVSYGDKTGTVGTWSKGALTTNLMQWLPGLLVAIGSDPEGLLIKCREGAEAMNEFFAYLYGAPAFLNKENSLKMSNLVQKFLSIYAFLASKCFALKQPWMFPLYPKLHALHHISLRLRHDALRVSLSMSPMMVACQQDEDTVGRVSRISRRVSPRLTMLRTLQRYLMQAYSHWVSEGLLYS